MRAFFGLVGIGMFLGFGAAFVHSWRELHAMPTSPRLLTVHEAVQIEEPGPGAWTELTDVRFPCDQPEQWAGNGRYRLGFGATEDDRIIVSNVPCSDVPVRVRGKLATASPGRIFELAFPGYDFDHWPRAWQSTLWTETRQDDSNEELFFIPPFALMGLLVAAFFLKPLPRPAATLQSIAGTVEAAPWRADEKVLPARPLALATASLFDRLLSFVTLLVMGWILLALGWFSAGSTGGWLGTLGLIFFGGGGAFLIVLALKAALGWRRNAPSKGPHTEALARLLEERPLLAEGVDVGNVVLRFTHPLTGAPIERVVGGQEGRPLLVDGYLFVVWGEEPDALMLVAEDFAPFALTPTEQRESLRRLVRWVANEVRVRGNESKDHEADRPA